MSTKIFVPGKNWMLSLAELISYLKIREGKFRITFCSKEFFVISSEGSGSGNVDIADLGGLIKIGEVKSKFPTEIVQKAFLKKSKEAQMQIQKVVMESGLANQMANSSNKVFFGVSIYSSEKKLHSLSWEIQRFVGSKIKSELANKFIKSNFMGFSKDRKFAQLSHVEVLKKNLVENKAEVLLCIGNKQTWIASTIAVHNPFEFQKRDIYKPNQRKIFGMPPRLAKIMVNLSSCAPGKVLLDPFCGVGTILQEALLAKAQVIGLDVNPWCVKAATENLEWIRREYNLDVAEYRVLQGEAGKLTLKTGQETVDCIVTEPDLGPALRHIPTIPYALKIIHKLEPIYFDFIEEAYKVLKKNGRLVLVTPYIRTRTGQPIMMPIGEKLEKTGLKRVYPFLKEYFENNSESQALLSLSSLIEIDKRHKIGRKISIFQK